MAFNVGLHRARWPETFQLAPGQTRPSLALLVRHALKNKYYYLDRVDKQQPPGEEKDRETYFSI